MARDSSAFQSFPVGITSGGADVVGFPRSGGRATLNRHTAAEWSTALGDRFNALTSLQRGWDGYDGRPVSFTNARFAAQLLERLCDIEVSLPSLVPGSDGTLQIEWHINGYDIEIDVLAPFNVIATRFDCLTEESEELELQADMTVLAHWISELKAPRAVLLGIEAA